MVTPDAGVKASVDSEAALFTEAPGRVVVETTDTEAVQEALGDDADVTEIGNATGDGTLSLSVEGASLTYEAGTIHDLRATLEHALE
jgi:phosphoribosylformylglycinamidine (FGAM) synthase-like enzyme